MTIISNAQDALIFRVPSPNGEMFVIVIEDEQGKACEFQIHIGKAGSDVAAWASGLAHLATMLLEHGGTITEIIVKLSNTSSAKLVYTQDKTPVRSGVDAFVVALHQYQRYKGGKYTEHSILKQVL